MTYHMGMCGYCCVRVKRVRHTYAGPGARRAGDACADVDLLDAEAAGEGEVERSMTCCSS